MRWFALFCPVFIYIFQVTDQNPDKSGLINEDFDAESGVEDEEIINKVHSESLLDTVIFIKEKQKHGNTSTDGDLENTNYTEQSVKDIVNDIIKDVENKCCEINMINEEEENINEELAIENSEVLKSDILNQ